MTVLHSGTTVKYSEQWNAIFEENKPKKKSTKKKASPKKKSTKKKASPKKKSTKKKASPKKKK